MAKVFQYVAMDAAGQKQAGELDLATRSEAMRFLQAKGLRPVTIKEATAGKKKKAEEKKEESLDEPVVLKNKDVIAFTEELSELLEAGLPLEPALASMEQRDESGVLKRASAKLRRWVTEGEQMYQALPRVSPAFDQLYCNLVKAGEASGSLQTILKQHGLYMKEQMELRARLTQAMIYPAFLILACVIVTLVFIFYLLPQITSLLEGMPGSEMPLGVKLATSLGDFLRSQWVTILVLAVAAAVAGKVWYQSEANKAVWDEAKLKLPVIGDVLMYGIYVQWLQTLGNLLANGVPLVQGLQLTSETMTNRYFKGRLASISDGVGDGYRLTRCMRKTEMFPANMVDLIAVGESTGKLARALVRAGEYYDKRLSILIKSVLGLISPIVLLAMAGLVALLSYTMIQAIYETMGNIKR
ncbi:type II secretion system F family protein [Rubritalea tangerina]|uniref:Type II secretion system F family protein n=1 Tax=Rubritalea tangerina TaxID=430798 RepID=A0ABW4ZAN2_9BACT